MNARTNSPMNAGEICNKAVMMTDRKTPVLQAAQMMRDKHVGSLVVVDETGAGKLVVGMITDRDIVMQAVAGQLDLKSTMVEQVMSKDTVTALERDSAMEVLKTMRRKGVRRIPVIKESRALVGIVTLDDMLGVMAEELRLMSQAIEAEHLREIRSRSER